VAVTVHPPTQVPGDPVTHDRAAGWDLGLTGSLEILAGDGTVIAEHAAGQWGYVEVEATGLGPG
jgi:hypothetical protein